MAGSATTNDMKGHPKVKPINLGRVTPGQSIDLDGIENYYQFDEDGSPKNFFRQMGRNASHLSVRDSFDYLDVNLNHGMDLNPKSRLAASHRGSQ
jgi:hypothetical protein